MPSREPHPCPVDECEVEVGGDHLMCTEHWYALPERMREGIWSAWRASRSDKGPVSAYVETVTDALAHLRQGTLV